MLAPPSTAPTPRVDHSVGGEQGRNMNESDRHRDTGSLVAQVSLAIRMARSRRGLSQRDLAQQIGVSKSRLARLESDAGPASLEMVCQVLMASGFPARGHRSVRAPLQPGGASAAAQLRLCDASGRRFPAHLEAYRMPYPPLYWFVRNGGWSTSAPFPEWTYVRRFVPRRAPSRRAGES